MMGDSHHRLGHFEGTDLVRWSSSLTAEDAHHSKPPLLRYTFSWKHLQDPAEFGRLEGFNEAVRRLESDHHPMEDSSADASHGGGGVRKRKAGEICHEVAPAVALESAAQVQVDSVVVIAAQSEIVVDADVVGCVGGGPEKKPRFPRLSFVCRKGRDAENGPECAPPEKTGERAGAVVDSFACERISSDDIRSPSISAPVDVVFSDGGNKTDAAAVGEHHQVVSEPGSGDGGGQETSPSSSPESFIDMTPSPRTEAAEDLEHPAASADVPGGGGPEKKPRFRGLNFLYAENGPARASLPEKTDCSAEGGVAASACGRISDNDDIRSPSISAPVDVVFSDGGDQTDPAVGEHHQVSVSGSSKVCDDDQETSPSSSPESPVDVTPPPPRTEALEHSPAADDARTESDLTSPLPAYLQVPVPASGGDFVGADDQDSGPSSPSPSDDTVAARAPSPSAAADYYYTGGGGVDLHRLGERIAMEMDEDALRAEVARQFGADRQRRAARRQPGVAAAVAPRVHFSLRLSCEEAMEDVAAVAVPEDVEPQAPAWHHGTSSQSSVYATSGSTEML